MGQPDWDARYCSGDTPWDTGLPDTYLVDFVRSGQIDRGHALEVGCGTGTNSLWLCRNGYTVLGIDVSARALKQARSKVGAEGGKTRFMRLDFLEDSIGGGPFNLVFDRGCFHLFDRQTDRETFARRVASLLDREGRWLSLIGSTEGSARDYGPPRRSARDVMDAIEPVLEILELRSISFRENLPAPVAAWLCLSRPRAMAAQSSTHRN